VPYRKKNFYLGIDLGSTNSLMTWGKVDFKTREVEPRIVPMMMYSPLKGTVKKELLPSFVYFGKNASPVAGEYAKAMMCEQPERVVKSVKKYMGTNRTFNFDGREWTPEEISALLLQQIKVSAGDFLGFEPDDVIITVPASCEPEMRVATIRAAALAGLKISENDGNVRNILLDEAGAVLFDFLYRRNREEILDITEPKRILVFDLGGDSLDISYHNVLYNQNRTGVEIEDIVTSRYRQMGGDVFDDLLAERLLEKFRKKINIDTLSEKKRFILREKFNYIAEQLKVKLNTEINNRIFWGKSTEGVSVDIFQNNVWQDKAFEYEISREEYEEIITPLLGEKFSLSQLNENFDKVDYDETRNIIYPIMEVLNRAKKELKAKPGIDGVILTGGMTQVPAIRDRLTGFFERKLIYSGEPDKTVAKGATIYHYMLHSIPDFPV